MVRAHCGVCGVYTNCHRCHVKSQSKFTEEERANDEDWDRNIVYMCQDHHEDFDRRKNLGIYRREEFEFLYVKFDHCCTGFCYVEPTSPNPGENDIVFVNPILLSVGFDPIAIDLEYIQDKNLDIKPAALRDLCMGKITAPSLNPCKDPSPKMKDLK